MASTAESKDFNPFSNPSLYSLILALWGKFKTAFVRLDSAFSILLGIVLQNCRISLILQDYFVHSRKGYKEMLMDNSYLKFISPRSVA